jgi:carbon dioxide concentrating mechanism protein CcmO
MAIEVGMQEAERVGELHAVMVIPRLLEDLEHTLPVANYWLEKEPKEEPLSLPQKQKETQAERQPLSLPQKQEETQEERQPLSFPQKEEETVEVESHSEEERPLMELPELEKIDSSEEDQEPPKRQQARPPEED